MFLPVFVPLLDIPFIDGSFVTGLLGALVSVAIFAVHLWVRQRRLWRAVFGSDDDQTRPGLLKRQEETREEITSRFDDLERHVDTQFADLEQRLAYRHDELSLTLAKVVQNMDDPPDDIDIYGPFRNRDHYDTDFDPSEEDAD